MTTDNDNYEELNNAIVNEGNLFNQENNDINNYLDMDENAFHNAAQQQIVPRQERLNFFSRLDNTGNNTRLSLGHPTRQPNRFSTPSSIPKDTRHGGKKLIKSRKSRKSKKSKKSRKSKKSKKSRTV